MFIPFGIPAIPIQAPADTQAANDARYRWMRSAWLEGAATDEAPKQLRAIEAARTEAEMDAAIDAELAKAGD